MSEWVGPEYSQAGFCLPSDPLARLLAWIELQDAVGATWVELVKDSVGSLDLHEFIGQLRVAINEAGSRTVGVHARETPTHAKWLLAEAPSGKGSAWIHDYRDHEAGGRFAETIHDHRYDFVSILLAGSFLEQTFEHDGDHLSVSGEYRSTTGDAYGRASAELHALSAIQGAVTLVVRSGRRRESSRSWGGTAWRTHIPFVEQTLEVPTPTE